MDIQEFAMAKNEAREQWKNYVKGCKENKDQFLLDMKSVYNQLKSGRKVIDILTVFERAGINELYQPKLAISKANYKEVVCEYSEDGNVYFKKDDSWRTHSDIKIIFPKLPKEILGQREYSKKFKTIVPGIPAQLKPKGNLKSYWILWEVEKWEKIPPKDPYLLKRLTKNMFVVLAGRNLTELERAVLRGRTY